MNDLDRLTETRASLSWCANLQLNYCCCKTNNCCKTVSSVSVYWFQAETLAIQLAVRPPPETQVWGCNDNFCNKNISLYYSYGQRPFCFDAYLSFTGCANRHHSVTMAIKVNRTRSSATAEKERVSCPHGGGLGPRAHSPPPPLATLMRMNESETRNKRTSSVPSTKRTLRWIRHSRSFKVILIDAGMNPERCVVVMCN